MTTRRTGQAGTHSRSMQTANRLRALAWNAAAIIAALAALAALAAGTPPLAAVAVVAAAGCWLTARCAGTRANKQGVGAKAEQQVSAAAARTGAYQVINGADLGVPGDADHVVMTPRGLAVVETKAGGGQVRVTKAGKVITGQGRVVPGDPIRQVLTQARALNRLTGHPATPIVCVPWMRNAPFQHNSVTFCSASQLPGVLRRLPGRLGPRDADRIARRLR